MASTAYSKDLKYWAVEVMGKFMRWKEYQINKDSQQRLLAKQRLSLAKIQIISRQ